MSASLFGSVAGDTYAFGVYFDHNATTPLCPAAREAWLKASDECWQNPSSLYRSAGRTNIFLNDAREELAELTGFDAERLVFTSGATEANHSLFAWLAEAKRKSACVAISAVEHPSVREPARRYFGENCIELPVDSEGVVDLDQAGKLIEEHEPVLVSVMTACNETGAIQPCAEIAAACQKRGAYFHSDATQVVGKYPLDRFALKECDFVTASGHKFGGPKGIGFLVVDSAFGEFRGQCGGPQERGFRAGTENYPAVAAMLAALDFVGDVEGDASMRDTFESAILEKIPGTRIVSKGAERLWNTSMLIMPEHEHVKWLTRLDRAGYQISTGSACSTGSDGPSHVLQAIGGFDVPTMKRALRISSGPATTREEWEGLVEAFESVAANLR